MTKALTEQWREGTLPEDTYYWKVCKENWIADKYEMYDYTKVCDVNKIECLAPVPSYDEVKEMSQKIERLEFDNEALEMAHNEGKEINAELVSKTDKLEKKLAIATNALKEINKNYRFTVAQDVVYKALKEMEGVK